MDPYSTYRNKRSIEKRIGRLAATACGIADAELADPVVQLLAGALSAEVYRISGEMENMENRLVEKLSAMLAPSMEGIAQPAHCLLYAEAQEGSITTVHTQNGFACTGANEQTTFTFYPACNTRIYNGQISYLIHKDILYRQEEDLSRTIYARSHEKTGAGSRTVWLGLTTDKEIRDLNGVSFYFDFQNSPDREECLQLLPYSVWKWQDTLLPVRRGIYTDEEEYENEVEALFATYDMPNRINRTVTERYNKHFLTIRGKCDTGEVRETLPGEIADCFPPELSDGEPLKWIQITFPEEFPVAAIESLQCSINIIPVVNKQLISKITVVNQSLPVIPLQTGRNESFLAVQSVHDPSGRRYYDFPVRDSETQQYGIYSLRRGGVERYSRREASEYLANITARLNRENGSFFTGRSDLKKIQAGIMRLIRTLNRLQDTQDTRYETNHYMLVDPEKEQENYFVSYWVTNGPAAHYARAGIQLGSLSEIRVRPESIRTVSPVTGGQHPPRGEKKDILFKKNLTRRELLVTHEDIRNFCLETFRDSVSRVEVKKGIMESGTAGVGFVRTTDVYMESGEQMKNHLGSEEEISFREILQQHSPATFHYRVFINKTELKQERE